MGLHEGDCICRNIALNSRREYKKNLCSLFLFITYLIFIWHIKSLYIISYCICKVNTYDKFLFINMKVADIMNQITREEAHYLAKYGVHCPHTCKFKRQGKSRGKYFAPDDKEVNKLLTAYRKTVKIVETYGDVNS